MYQELEPTRPKRRDAGMLQITERDISALSWIAEQYCIAFDHLQQLLGQYSPVNTKNQNILSIGATRNALDRWLQLGYIETPRKIVRSYSTHIWLSRKGLRELQLPFAYYVPNPTNIAHFYAVNAIRLFLQVNIVSLQWLSHRSVERETETRPLPDAEVQMEKKSLVGIQVIENTSNSLILRDAYKELETLINRRQANKYYYERLWYFLQGNTLQPIREKVLTLDKKIQNRVILYTMDMQEISSL